MDTPDTDNVITLRPQAEDGQYAGDASLSARMLLLKSIAESGGIRLPKTILPEGHGLWDVGEENKRKMATSIDKLPVLSAALEGYSERLEAESAVDVPNVPAQKVRMHAEDGRLFGEGHDPAHALGYTRSGLSQVAQFIKPATVRNGFVENLLALPNKLRAEVFNYHAENAIRTEPVHLRTVIEPRSGARIIRAVTSSKHSLINGDDTAIVAAMQRRMDVLSKAKARITREPDRSDFELIWPTLDRQLVVGDICYVGLRISNSETKAGSLKVKAFVQRVLCANFTNVASEGGDEDIELRHVGDLRAKLTRAFATAMSKAEPFVKAFGDAYKVQLPMSRGEVLTKVGKVYSLPDGTLNLAGQLWDADGEKGAGDTLAGLVNALTRASQEQTMSMADVTENAAGELIARGWAALG